MSKKILFTILAHECQSCINDLTESIRISYPDSYIVFHINQKWTDFNPELVNGLNDYVFINTNRLLVTDKHEGLTGIHISNIEYFQSLGFDFDFVVFGASNELYIYPIDIDYFIQYQYGSSHSKTPSDMIIRGFDIHAFCKEKGLVNGGWNGYVEGMWMNKDLCIKLMTLYKNYFGYLYNLFPCDNEQIPHTILYNIVEDNGIMGTSTMIDRDNTLETIKHIKNYNKDTNSQFFNKFSCKPIDRNNPELRKKIMEYIRTN